MPTLTPQVVGYVSESIKRRMLVLKEKNRRMTESRQVEEALEEWLLKQGLADSDLKPATKKKGA